MRDALRHELPVLTPGTQLHTCAVRCGARCCNYLSLTIDTPRSAEDFDDLRWYLMHEDTHVYKYEGDWYLLVERRCRHLLPSNVCGNYENRPRTCADHDPSDCEFVGEVDYELYFRDDAELERWLLQRTERRRAAARKAAETRRATARAKP
jgi:hypothetical protein